MLPFFTDPYPNEILYSTIARYHFYSGNIDYKDTLQEMFGSRNIVATVAFPSHLEYLANQFPKNPRYSSRYFIQYHTLWPYYAPFFPKERKQIIQKEMKYSDGKRIYTKVGMVAGSICEKNALCYCPLCVLEDIKQYGESYFHRVHQVQGVKICPQHECLLKLYPVTVKEYSRIGYIRCEKENIDQRIEYETKQELQKVYLLVAQGIEFLENLDFKMYHQKELSKIYRNFLESKEYLSYNGRVKQRKLYKDFISFYGENTLISLESNIDEDNESNWLKMLVRKPKKVIHPLRNILLIQFLAGEMERFFKNQVDERHPFGKAPWPCLNPVANHYGLDVIDDCLITSDYKTRQPIGTFRCKCGFVYARKGPDQTKRDRYRVGRIKQFGSVWESRLRELLLEKQYGLRAIAREMKCDPKTIVKYAAQLGVQEYIPSSMKIQEKTEKNIDTSLKEIYKNDFFEFMKKHPGYTRQQIRNVLKKQYAWFYRNDKKWIEEYLPKPIARGERNKNTTRRVDWNQRDEEIQEKIEKVYNTLIALEKPVRITQSLLGKKIGKAAILQVYLDKLPKTARYLEEITETVEDFQIRRVDHVCNLLFVQQHDIKKWQIIRFSGLKKGYSKRVEKRIEDNIRYYVELDEE